MLHNCEHLLPPILKLTTQFQDLTLENTNTCQLPDVFLIAIKYHIVKTRDRAVAQLKVFLNLITASRFYLFVPINKRKSPLYLLERMLGEHQSQSDRGKEKKNSLSLPGIEPLVISPVASYCTG
jgi:hypothetical protein